MVDVGKYTIHGCYEMWLNPLNFKMNTPKNDVFFLFFKESPVSNMDNWGVHSSNFRGVYMFTSVFSFLGERVETKK